MEEETGSAMGAETARKQHMRVPVFQYEKRDIEANARQAGLSAASFLRALGQGYEVRGVLDYEKVGELAKINADLGRLGGLLKLWLTDDARLARFTERDMEGTVRLALDKINQNMELMRGVMETVVLRERQQ